MLALPALAIATWLQVGYWRDSRTLAEHALAVTGDNANMLWMLGNVAAGEGKADEAVAQFLEALRIQPRFPEVHLALATVLAERGDFEEALVHSEAVLRLWPDDTTALVMRGRMLARMGRQADALKYFAGWARHDPDSAEAHAELGAELGRAGRSAEAVAELTRPLGIPTIASLNPIMVDGTGMCGGCRVAVGGETRFACVDGPEFDAHRVDFDLLARRNRAYAGWERKHDIDGTAAVHRAG